MNTNTTHSTLNRQNSAPAKQDVHAKNSALLKKLKQVRARVISLGRVSTETMLSLLTIHPCGHS